MDKQYPFKNFLVFIVTFIFLVFPFYYFYQLLKINDSNLLSPQMVYPVITLAGFLFALFIEKNIRYKPDNNTAYLIFLSAILCLSLYAAFLFFMTISRYANYISEVIDVSFFHTIIWELSEFKIPYLWLLDQPMSPAWSQHFSPILIFIAPLYWLIKNAGLLMIVQAAAVISGVFPIYLLCKLILKSRSIGLSLAFAYLAFGGLQFGYAYGFHEIMFFPALFFWAYYFYVRKKSKSYFLFILLSLIVKEETAFIVGAWSIYLLLFKRDKFYGLITAAFAFFWYLLCFNLIFPYFNHGKEFGYWGQYSQEGGSGALGIIKFILLNPLGFFKTLVTPTVKIETFLQTFGAFSFLLFLYPPSLIIVVPSLLEKLLSSGIAMGNGAHYSAAITAVTIIATIESFPHFYRYTFIKKYIHNKNVFFSILIVYIALFSNIFYGYRGYSLVPFVHNTIYEKGLDENNHLLLNKIIDAIPDNAVVAAQYQILPHIKRHYTKLISWPGTTGKEDFIIIDTELIPVLGATSEDYNKEIDKLSHNNTYQLAVSQYGILVYRKSTFKKN